jgi:hypothetical protein
MHEASINKMQDFFVYENLSFYLYVFFHCFMHTKILSKKYKPIKNKNYDYYCQIEPTKFVMLTHQSHVFIGL